MKRDSSANVASCGVRPVAMAAFYLKGVSPPEVTLAEIYWGMMPFMALQVVGLVIVYFFPELTTWLPKLAFGG